MRLHDLLEVFNQTIDFKWTKKDPGLWQAMFVIDSINYIVSLSGTYTTEISFAQIDYENGINHSITNTGNAFVVFSTVKSIITDFLRECNPKPERLAFVAKKNQPSRVRLYRKFAKRLGKFKESEDTKDIYFMFDFAHLGGM